MAIAWSSPPEGQDHRACQPVRRASAPAPGRERPSVVQPATSPDICANSSISTTRKPCRFTSCWTIYRPIPWGALRDVPSRGSLRIVRRLEFHVVPEHASWLNMVEIEIGVLRGQCLDRRIDDPKRLRREITAWERRRNAAGAQIKWMFTTDKARHKMGRAYPNAKES